MAKSKSKKVNEKPKSSSLYHELFNIYKEATSRPHQRCDKEVPEIWNRLKTDTKNFPANVHLEISRYKTKIEEKKKKCDRVWATFTNLTKKPPDKVIDNPESQLSKSPEVEVVLSEIKNAPERNGSISADGTPKAPSSRTYNRPAEKELKEAIGSLNDDVVYLTNKRDKEKATPAQLKALKEKRQLLQTKTKRLKRTIDNRINQRKCRERRRKLLADHPEIAKQLRWGWRDQPGQPPLEEDQPSLLQAICDIATHGAPAHERRRSEALRSIKTLSALTKQLESDGYKISRTAVYYRLLPRRGNTIEGRRHVNTVPVRLKRASNDEHKNHVDQKFCQTTINYLEQLASILGPGNVLFISQDDKARVPLGITAANKQAPMLMHLQYQIKLPDHDWVVAERHKLIPSVYGVMIIKPNMIGDLRAVTYSGPTYIAIRSGKHCSSTAFSHARDFDMIMNDHEFYRFTHDENGNVKPVVMIIVDGGPDENPRYEKVITSAIDHFKNYDLDALFIATNAPGRSAYNRVERRMAPLSNYLCGTILEHDHFGSHLDERGKTIDPEKEKNNFEYAGIFLAKIWNKLVLDTYQTKAVYVKPEDSEKSNFTTCSEEWKSKHVRESNYFLQIRKCLDSSCCSPHRGTISELLPGFLPAPLCIEQSTLKAGVQLENGSTYTSLLLRLQINDSIFRNAKSQEVPYDLICPSLKEILGSRVCPSCGVYFASIKSMKCHKKFCRNHSALNANETLFGENMLSVRRVKRPVRVAAQRGREKMILWTTQADESWNVDWIDEDQLENVEVENEIELEKDDHCNIIDISQYMEVIWEEDVATNK